VPVRYIAEGTDVVSLLQQVTKPRFYRFMKLYSTALFLPGNYGKVIADPVRIEVYRGPRGYDVLVPVPPPILPAGISTTMIEPRHLEFPGDRTYVELIARTEESPGKRQYCEDQIDRTVTQLSAILSPLLFQMEAWSGWLCEKNHLFTDGWFMRSNTVGFNPEEIKSRIDAFRGVVNAEVDIEKRFTLMSKLFTRAIAMQPGEERFLWLWTVLEVFPMKGTSDIRPVGDYLSHITGRPAPEVKEKLGIGRIFGARSDLVHDGKLPYDRNELVVCGEQINHYPARRVRA
jgi:hypothetical protein